MKGLLQAVKYLNLNDYLHRDIKPGNIVLTDPNDLSSVKLIDFGLADRLQLNAFHQSEEQCGTLIYQPPEQAIHHKYGKPADLWAVGFVMYEMLTGRHPIWHKGIGKGDYIK